MKHLVKFSLKDGGSIVVEVDEAEGQGTVRAGRGDTIIQAKGTLEDALDDVLPVATGIADKLRGIGNMPDEIEVSFGVKLSTDVGAIIAAIHAEGNFDVKVRWTEKKEKPLF